MEAPYDFLPPGGQFQKVVGDNVSAVVVTVQKMVHQVITTAELTTIVAPWEGFVGPVWLVASSVFKWTTSGNIAKGPGTTIIAGKAYGFIRDPNSGYWYPISGTAL